ncbi:MAG: hypothetical protein VKN72_03930 [Nostocales cyanobacterium 94392]|nr:hypothetical protein [Nostocales cyanobacterium 94392]
MSDRIDDIYKILIEYIESDNKYKIQKQEADARRTLDTQKELTRINDTLVKVEKQTTLTNGRVTALEKVQTIDKVKDKVNWKWILAIVSGLVGVITFILNLLAPIIVDLIRNLINK